MGNGWSIGTLGSSILLRSGISIDNNSVLWISKPEKEELQMLPQRNGNCCRYIDLPLFEYYTIYMFIQSYMVPHKHV
jgi:hypothetical protein